ncbi:MAG: hypothetical protein ACPIA2_15470 [Mariniblastus sp.]
MIIFLTADLMMASTASSHARQNNVTLQTATSAEAAMALVKEARPHLFLVDLQVPGLGITELGDAVRGLPDALCPMTIAYAQHVNLESLDEARRAGFDQVLTRGQFNQQVGTIIADAK